jgi:hypothetical protein
MGVPLLGVSPIFQVGTTGFPPPHNLNIAITTTHNLGLYMQLTIFALIAAICTRCRKRLALVPEEEPKVEDHDVYEMEVPGDTSNDTCMFEKSEELHDTQIELDPFAVSTQCFCNITELSLPLQK